MEQGTIKGVFSSNKDGEEYITRNGNPFLKVMVVVGDDAYYDSFFLTPKAHWKFDSLFQACGRVAPSFDEFKFADVESLIGSNVLVRVGKERVDMTTSTSTNPSPIRHPKSSIPSQRRRVNSMTIRTCLRMYHSDKSEGVQHKIETPSSARKLCPKAKRNDGSIDQ